MANRDVAAVSADAAHLEAAAAAFLTASRALVGMSVRSMGATSVSLTVPQHRLLVLVSGGTPRRVGDLAEDLGVNQSNASRLVDRMVAQDLVKKVNDLQDGRVSFVIPTATGRRVLQAVNEHRLRQLREVLARMSPTARQRAVEVLAEFNTAAHEQDAVPLDG